MTTKTKTAKPKPVEKPAAKPSAVAEKPSAKARRIREQKAADDAAEAEALGKLFELCPDLHPVIGGRPLLKRSDRIAWNNDEWNELEEVCRKFRRFFEKLTLVQCELIARTHMKTSWRQLVGLPKAWHVWTDAANPTPPVEVAK